MGQEEPTVFVVDDDHSVLRSLQRLLRSAGWATEAFDSAEEFLRVRDPAAHGCVILDLAMPGLDGLAVQERLIDEGMPLPPFAVNVSMRALVPSSAIATVPSLMLTPWRKLRTAMCEPSRRPV